MRSLLLLAVVPLLAALSGCLSCQPTVDVRHCPEPTGNCAPRPGDRVVAWKPDLASLWPDLPRLMANASDGGHEHAEWTQNQADAFWTFWQVEERPEGRQLFMQNDGQTYRVRILAC